MLDLVLVLVLVLLLVLAGAPLLAAGFMPNRADSLAAGVLLVDDTRFCFALDGFMALRVLVLVLVLVALALAAEVTVLLPEFVWASKFKLDRLLMSRS